MKTIYNGFFTVVFALIATTAFAQGVITGTVIDTELNEPLPGANVVVKGTTTGVSTDFDGKFRIEVPQSSGTLVVSYIGFVKKEVRFTSTGDIGNISLQADAEELEGVVVVGSGVIDLAIGRQTPVAVSTITAKGIKKTGGNEEFPTLLRKMPSVYANTQGGGYGDSEVRVRGFDQSNTAVLINGQPVNGMEDGNMYWSNWQGVKDIATAVQVQRGLGASKLAISSVGGTVNIVTQSYNDEEGGYVSQELGNGNYTKSTAYYATGANDKGWSSTYMLSYWHGDGYFFKETEGEGLTYFFSVGYKPSDKHAFNFLITGAPQKHDQAYQNSIGDALRYGKDYNSNWGYRNGNPYNERVNFYHKPVINFNWDWNISDRSTLSTVAYASIGSGGGTGPMGFYANKTNEEGLINFDDIIAHNESLPTTNIGGENQIIGDHPDLDEDLGNGYITRASMNNHYWVGTVSNFNHKINDNFEFNVGVDYRFYHGDHYRQVVDFMGLDGWYEGGNASIPQGQIVYKRQKISLFGPTLNKVRNDQQIDYSNSEDIAYVGGFGQFEYKTDKFSAFIQGSISSQSHVRYDYFAYSILEGQESEKVTNSGYNIKGGLNYNINDQHNVFFNAGHYSRQPFHDNIFLTFTNEINPLTDNEKITSFEIGYGFRNSNLNVNLNGYYTKWGNRTRTESLRLDLNEDNIDEDYFANFTGLEQTHIGLELDFLYRPINAVSITGFASVGNWKFTDNPTQNVFLQDDLSIVPELSDTESYINDKKVGRAPQTSFNLGVQYNILENLSVDADWFYYGDLYADYDPLSFTDPDTDNDILKLPTYDIFRLGASYTLPLEGRKSIDFRANVDNLFNEVYLASMDTNRSVEEGSQVYKGINTSNRATFGLDRQWNISVRFNF
ncbi:TonB-dependent receptor domain-containing protein [Sinomicrobium sp. M5D2P9]